MAYVGAVNKIGLINDTASPAERVFVEDVSDESEATVREVPDTETDPEGQTVFSGYMSELTLAALDVQGQGSVSTWMDDRTPVKAFLELPEAAVMWTRAARITTMSGYSPTESGLQKAMYSMSLDAGDINSHGVLLTRNLLAPHDNAGAVSETFAWPIDDSTLTLSADFAAGGGTVDVEAQDDTGTALTSASDTSSSSGRISVDFTTPKDTYFLKVDVSGDSPQNPALRLDGSDQFVTR
jgi:hypothetical protein